MLCVKLRKIDIESFRGMYSTGSNREGKWRDNQLKMTV